MNTAFEYVDDAEGRTRFAHMLEHMPFDGTHGQAPVRKGAATRAAILAQGLHIASLEGLDRVSFGSVAAQLKMTRSGVFAHFQSKDKLLLAVLEFYEKKFRDEIFLPSLNMPRGLPRLDAMLSRWVNSCIGKKGGDCILISGAMAGQMEQGPVRDKLTEMVLAWKAALHKCIGQAIDTGHLGPDTDRSQLLCELYGIILALHQQARFLGLQQSSLHVRKAFKRLIHEYEC